MCLDADRDAAIVVALDAVTSIFAGFAIFSGLGYLAHTLGTTVDNVVVSGALACVIKSYIVFISPIAIAYSIWDR